MLATSSTSRQDLHPETTDAASSPFREIVP